MVVHSGGKRNEALVKAFKAAGAAVDECPKISSAGERVAFVRNEVRHAGGKITPDAVTALLDAVGDDLRHLSAAASQLVSDFGGDIDADAVARFHQRPGRGHRLHRRRAGAGRRLAPARSRCCAGRWSAASRTC